MLETIRPHTDSLSVGRPRAGCVDCHVIRRALGTALILLPAVAVITGSLFVSSAVADPIEGQYLEIRTCQVYTGPCFANGEVGLSGKDAVMAWKIQRGQLDGVDLAGLGVAMVVRSTDTLGHGGLLDAGELQSMVILDDRATSDQRRALLQFAKQQTNVERVKAVQTASIELGIDVATLSGQLQVGDFVEVKARKARPSDCICSNESAFYPPLAALKGFVPGVTIEGEVTVRPLGRRWSIPDSRTAYLGTFEVVQ